VPGDGTLNFSLDDDSDPTLSNTRTFSNLAPASGYTVTETVPSGWDQSSAVCDDGSSPASIDLAAGEAVTCTFANVKRGSIVVVKDAQPNDPQDFSFTAGGGLSPSSFSLDDDSDGTLSNTRTFANVLPGSGYSVSESVPAGWSLASATCDDGSPISNINVAAGETVTCTWTNQRHGQIHVIADSQPNDAQDFSFTAGGGLSPAGFSLDDDSDGTLSNTQAFNDVAPGSGYTIGESTPAGWDLSSATCDDGSPTFNISVGPGEVVTCTFTNVKRGRIVIVKDAVPDDPQDFSFTTSGGLSPASFSLDDDSNGTLSNTQTFNNVAAGTYSVSEQPTSGWVQDGATCDDGSTTASISVAAGETVTCTFTNSRKGQLVVVKDAQPNDAQDFSFTAGGGLSPSSFQLDDDSDGTLSNTRTFTSVDPGSGYSVSETVPGGWDQMSATCDDGSPVANVSISAGETVTCTFTNRKRGQIVVVKDAQPNDPQDFSFTAGGGLSPTTFSLDDDADATLSNTRTFANVVPGSGYSVSETLPANWSQSGAACSDGSPVTSIDVSAGENVTCTFTNIRGYARPKAATPVSIPFVNAYNSCGSTNRSHAAPLTYNSCNPPVQSSAFVTTGTPDANGKAAGFIGNVLMRAISGDVGTPADEADVSVDVHVEDVRQTANVNNDYTGQLGVELPMKITDRNNGPSGTEIGTVQEASLVVPVPCVGTSGSTIGGTCDVSTTLDSVLPGTVIELKRANWELGQLLMLDGGPDGLVSTNDNTVFARQGVFVP
jgi:plastocyanin